MRVLSRTTRDEGARVEVCPRCGDREALYGYNPVNQVPLTDWPLSIVTLVQEERHLLTRYRNTRLSLMTITPGEARDILDGHEEPPVEE